MPRSTPWSSRQRYVLPQARQLMAIWGFYLILLLAELSAAKQLFDLSAKKVCETESCKERAKMILASMNQTEDPCTDFYEYACGNWTKTHKIPDDQTEIGPFNIPTIKLWMVLKNILLNATLEEEEPQNATDKAILAYSVCVCETFNETAKFNNLLKLLKEYGFTKWPLLSKEESPYENYTQLLNQSTFHPFVRFEVYQDAKNNHSNVIYLDQILFGWVNENELINQTTEAGVKMVAAYKKLIESTTKVFRRDLTDDKAQQLSEDILQFEATLAKHSKADEDRGNLSSMYNEMNISTLSKTYPKIEWLKLFNNMFAYANMTLDQGERVIVMEPAYFHNIQEILEKANISTLYNYVYWTWIRIYGAMTSKELGNVFFDFDREKLGAQKDEPLWKKCLTKISHLIPHALGRLYVDKTFHPKAKKAMDKLVGVINSTFGEMLENNTWMDNPTREEAMKKLQKMAAKIYYPPWILNDTYLNGLYEHVPPVFLNDSFLNVLRGLILNSDIQLLLSLRKPYRKEDAWYTRAAVADAFYYPITYDITFIGGILMPPFVQDDVPSSINMGTFGIFMGHKITDWFVDGGSHFDADGQQRDWWTESARDAFLKNAECFIEQYGNVTVKEENLALNGMNNPGENMADNSALKAAYLAFKKLNDAEEVLPGLNLTGDQLFFLSNAMDLCKKFREKRLRNDVEDDPHSPGKYRVNLAMGNSPEFLAAFSCDDDSPMNIKKKCTMW
ncbi:neprilysin-1-like [Ixodes scapularis]|uniref:neprilysin-1-like n=1 Tax=Ixodes scapularis TaxID=6945 RepID=UPI001A9FB4E6|nr:neprilysin-1-like [Ixodes scapularis]